MSHCQDLAADLEKKKPVSVDGLIFIGKIEAWRLLKPEQCLLCARMWNQITCCLFWEVQEMSE